MRSTLKADVKQGVGKAKFLREITNKPLTKITKHSYTMWVVGPKARMN
jgi:hypothetical protein